MALDISKVELGPCDVTWNSLDLGGTKGGVQVDVKTSTYTVKSDQTGETPLKDIVTGTTVSVKVPLLETDMDRFLALFPQATKVGSNPSADGISISTGVNVDLFQAAHELLLHPTGVSGSDKTQDFGMFKAAAQANISFKYEANSERVFEVTFTGYPDTAHLDAAGNPRICWFGTRPNP